MTLLYCWLSQLVGLGRHTQVLMAQAAQQPALGSAQTQGLYCLGWQTSPVGQVVSPAAEQVW